MTRVASRSILSLSTIALAATLSACGSSSGGSSGDSASSGAAPLQVRAVKSESQGSCASHSTTMVEDHGSCLHLGKPAMTVHSVKSAKSSSDPQPSVIVTLGADDSRRLQSLTTTVSKRSGSQQRIAILVGAGSDHRVVSAPTVMEPMTNGSLQLSVDSAKQAKQLAHDLGGS
ncbi:SecDF P1 head subdomain-containing protein [Flexivirga sp. B27]